MSDSIAENGDTADGEARPFAVRALTPDDEPLLRDMLDVFGTAFAEPHNYSAQQPDAAYLRELLSSRNFIAVAAIAGQKVLGGLTAYVLPKPEQDRREIYIHDLAVDAAHRRRGVASALIRELRHIAHERGAHVLFIQAERDDVGPVALYGSLGTRLDMIHFELTPLPR